MNFELKKAATEFKSWFVDHALPLWSTVAVNSQTGASYERLLSNGQPDLACPVRVRVQARQIFVFCMAQELGWVRNAGAVVDGMVGFVDKFGRHPGGKGYVHLLNADNEVIDAKQDLYDHAFHMLANIWRYRVFQQPQAMDEAEAIYAFLEEKFPAPSGGWFEGDYSCDYRRQNPHMHLFEAFLAGFEATQNPLWLERATAMFRLFEKHFYHAESRALLEYFNDDWSPAAGREGTIIEPGHMLEWVWLLRNFGRVSGVNVDEYANALYESALSKGMTAEGLLYDELLLDGSIALGSKRCWPMTELIKASIAQARAGNKQCEAIAAKAIRDLMRVYLQAQTPGAYIDRLGLNDEVIADFAPASTLYHLIVAAAEVCAYLEA